MPTYFENYGMRYMITVFFERIGLVEMIEKVMLRCMNYNRSFRVKGGFQ